MKNTIAIVFVTMLYSLTAQAAPQIPSAFQGKWAAKKDCHFFIETTTPDPGVEVTSTDFNRMENYCKLEKVVKTSAKSFTGAFVCTVEGEESKDTITIKLGVKNQLSYKGSPVLSKCK